MSDKPTLVVLAAGMGSRYGGLKQIDPVGPSDEVILDYSVFDAIRAGFGKIVFVIRRDIEDAFKEAIGSKYEGKIAVDYAFQSMEDVPAGADVPADRTKPWGTTHATLAARHVVTEPFGVINADDFYGRGSFQLLGDALRARFEKKADYVQIGFPLKNTISDHGTVSRGISEVGPDGRLTSVEECHDIKPVEGGIEVHRTTSVEILDGSQTVSMNMWGFTPDVFDLGMVGFEKFIKSLKDPLKGEYYIPTLIQELINAGAASVEVQQAQSTWLGVTYPEDKPSVMAGLRKLVDEREYPADLWS